MCHQNLELSIRSLMCIDSNIFVSHSVCWHWNMPIKSFLLLRYPLDNTARDYRLFVANPLLGIVYIAMPEVINTKLISRENIYVSTFHFISCLTGNRESHSLSETKYIWCMDYHFGECLAIHKPGCTHCNCFQKKNGYGMELY